MYQGAFMTTPQDKYYNVFLDTLVKDNNRKGAPFSNDKIWQAVGKVIEETEAEFERNYNEITCDTSFQSPIQKKDVSTINDSVYYDLGNQVDMISYSNKQVDPSSNPNEDTHIIDMIGRLSVRPIFFEAAVVGVIGQDLVTNGRENLRVELSLKSFSPLNEISSNDIVVSAACNSAQVDRKIRNPSRFGTPEVNIDFFSPSRVINSSFTKCSRNI